MKTARKSKYNNDAKQIKQKPFVTFLPSLNPELSCIVQEDITRLSIPVLCSSNKFWYTESNSINQDMGGWLRGVKEKKEGKPKKNTKTVS